MSPSIFTSLMLMTIFQLSSSTAELIAFGDSYSDSGHGANSIAALGTNQVKTTFFPAPPYYKGRFSDGPIWLETAAKAFRHVLDSFAFGGAVTGAPGTTSRLLLYPPYANTSSFVEVEVPSGVQQAAEFLRQRDGIATPQSIYILALGTNDYLNVFSGMNASVVDIVQTIEHIVQVLYNAGAKKFLVVNVPPFDKAPIFSPPFTPADDSAAFQATAAHLIATHNSALIRMVSSLTASHPDAYVMIYDIHTFLCKLIANAAVQNFTEAQTPCYKTNASFPGFAAGYVNPVCSHSGRHIFWDGLHFTERANFLLAQDFTASFPELRGS